MCNLLTKLNCSFFCAGKNMDSFISKKSLNFFSRFNIDTSFLQHSPENWDSLDSYVKGREIVESLKVVNDTAERSVKLMQEFHGLITKDEQQKQYIFQCVEEHRKKYPNCQKTTLMKEF